MQQQMTILIVEDDSALLDGLVELLGIVDLGYDLTLLKALNGVEALVVMADHTPDLIISGVMMPEMGGYTFLQNVRQNSAWEPIPFIFLTARSAKLDVARGLLSGADLHITKPYNTEDLLAAIKEELTYVALFHSEDETRPGRTANARRLASKISVLNRRLGRLQAQREEASVLVEAYLDLKAEYGSLQNAYAELQQDYRSLMRAQEDQKERDA